MTLEELAAEVQDLANTVSRAAEDGGTSEDLTESIRDHVSALRKLVAKADCVAMTERAPQQVAA